MHKGRSTIRVPVYASHGSCRRRMKIIRKTNFSLIFCNGIYIIQKKPTASQTI